jgi:hypothetical protein
MQAAMKSTTTQQRQPRIESALALMEGYKNRTGSTADQCQVRYLWTDAFAVCNYLSLSRRVSEGDFEQHACRLVESVHQTLGRHHDDDPRQGWLSGLAGQEARLHPTQGGLRIGKDLPERRASEPLEERLEWERDGQYFHYLTRWMHALDQLARRTGNAHYNRWARELARVAADAFIVDSLVQGRPRMYWKMSIDLSRPLVSSMGHHDPLDGLITFCQLEATAARLGKGVAEVTLNDSIAAFTKMIEGVDLATTDPLGLGGLMTDANRVAQLMTAGYFEDGSLLSRLLSAASRGLDAAAPRLGLANDASLRLGFRECGLAIGLRAISRLIESSVGSTLPLSPTAHRDLDALAQHLSLAEQIEAFWLDPEHRQAQSWLEHRNINEVMLATALVPDSYVSLETIPFENGQLETGRLFGAKDL